MPTGLRSEPDASIAFLLTICPLLAMLVRKGANDVCRWKTACVGLAASTLDTAENSEAYPLAVSGSAIRLKL